MGLRSLIAKRFGPSLPPAIEAGQQAAQMGPDHPFSPGEPVRPYDGFSRQPREFDFATSYNVATRPRTHERVSFQTLKDLIGSYDIADICIWHRIDSIRSLDWQLTAADGYSGDVEGAVTLAKAALRKPDREHYFKAWLAKYLYDVLAYDAGSLYKMRNRGGRCIGLMPVDGTTIAPLLDYWGRSPGSLVPAGEPLPEAYVQFANGIPWGWLTRDDLVYEPYRPHNDSPYGHAPIESIILNANTDLRFQVYFLERFTAGNIPEAFASAPESWGPDQIEQFQALWDSIMYGDQARKHQIRWMPGGSTLAWSNEKDFSDTFSLHMMRKTCAAFHVVPSDLGITDTVNKATGESQADVQHRVGDLPMMEHVEGILTAFLYDDLGLPLQFQFDRGEEQDDQLNVAQADDLYAKMGVVSVSELREMRFGLTEPAGQIVPRFIYATRAGPIPLSSLLDVAGPTDQETGAPEPGSALPHVEFSPLEGVVPMPPPKVPGLAERMYGPSAIPSAPPPQPELPALPVAKDTATGITSGTGLTSYDLDDEDDEEDQDDEDEREELAKAELAAFRRFEKTRCKAGTWRDFRFTAIEPEVGRHLNAQGRALVAKGGGLPKVEAPGLPDSIRPAVIARRKRLRRKHLKAVAAAWDTCVAELSARSMVRGFREDTGLITKAVSADQRERDWWKTAALAAALAWLQNIYDTDGYPALEVAVEDAIRGGMAEGQADALAAAAARRGDTAGLSIAAAFTAAYGALAGTAGIPAQAQSTIERMIGGAGTDLGNLLTDMAGDDSAGEEDMTSAAVSAVTGTSARSLVTWISDAIQAAIGAGALDLFSRQAQAQDGPVLVAWMTDGAPCLVCQDNEAGGPYTPRDVPPYPQHPRCQCELVDVSRGA